MMRRSVAGIAAVGAVSGALTNVADAVVIRATQSQMVRSLAGELYVGVTFGVFIAAYFIWRDGVRTAIKGVLFVGISAAAYLIALSAATFAVLGSSHSLGAGSTPVTIPLLAPLAGGAVGAFPLMLGALFLFGTTERGFSWLTKVWLGTAAGALLGVIGWAAGATFGRSLVLAAYALHLRPPGMSLETDVAQQIPQFFSLHVIWQAGLAAVIGYFASHEVASDSTATQSLDPATRPPRNRLMTTVGGVVIAGLLAYLTVHVTRTVRQEKAASQRMDAYHKAEAEAPSQTNLPPVPPLGINDTLVMEDLGGLQVEKPMVGPLEAFGRDPKTYTYSVAYVPNRNAPFRTYQPMVRAFVDQYPNVEWAQYRTKYPKMFNPALDERSVLSTVTKFGLRIVMNTMMRGPDGSGALYYLWPSRNLVVLISYEMPSVDEVFIKRYLEKHPSSW